MLKDPNCKPKLVLAEFVEVTSKRGNKYFRGLWDGMEIDMHLVKTGKFEADSGGSLWELIVSERGLK